jgi:hypothetical protein
MEIFVIISFLDKYNHHCVYSHVVFSEIDSGIQFEIIKSSKRYYFNHHHHKLTKLPKSIGKVMLKLHAK